MDKFKKLFFQPLINNIKIFKVKHKDKIFLNLNKQMKTILLNRIFVKIKN